MKKFTLLFLLLSMVAIGYSQVLPDNWTGDSGIDTYQESTNIHGGTYSCKVDVNTGSQSSTDMRHDEVSVTAGDSYTYSFWVWTSAHIKARVVLEWTGASITYGGYSSVGTAGFEEVVYTGTVPTGATGVKVGYRFYDVSGFSAPETQYVDDVTFESPTGTPIALANGAMENWPGGGTGPVITNILNTPEVPQSTETVEVQADVTDDGTVSTVECQWGTTDGGPYSTTINMSLDAGDTYVTDSDIPAQADGTTVYYVIEATDNDSETTTSSQQDYTVTDPATTTLPYNETFDTDLGDCYTYSVSGNTKEWFWNSGGWADMNGYNSGETEEDWLIVPGIDFDSYIGEFMTFDTWYKYGTDDTSNYLKLFYSADYPGLGDPSGSTWTELTFTHPAASETWTSSGTVDLSSISGTTVYIAFKYNYSSGSYRNWRVDNISIQETTSDPEPSNYPTAFTATANSAFAITTDWIDATGAQLPSGYLILANLTGTFTAPVDGTPVADDTDMSDGEGAMNIAYGVETYQWTGLSESTQYFFIIYPYSNSASSIDYKTDGTPPTDDATTNDANTDLIISEVADPRDHYQGRFVELYNLGTSSIDFGTDVWYLVKQSNGGSYSHVQLSGTLPVGGTYVVGYNDGNFSGVYGFSADLYSGVITGNGDDGYFLYFGGDEVSGTLIDAYGVADEDGSGKPWEYTDTKAVRLRSITTPNANWTAGEWDIPGVDANADDMTPGAYRENVNWLGGGTITDDWNEKGGNWPGTYGYIPDASFNVTIPQTTVGPVIYSESACNELTVQGSATLDISVNVGLTAYGNLDVLTGGSFTILSDANGNGSFIGKDMLFGDVTVERYIAAYSSGNDGWHQISSPIDMMTIAGSDFEPGPNDDLYEWMEQTNIWHNYKSTGSFTEFYGGQGYLAAYQTTATKQFIGELTGWDFGFTNLPYTPSAGKGWNFMGNPYPSAIEWDATSSDWALSNIGGVAEIWDESAGNYALINNGDVIPSTNGFFVQATNATNSMTIPAAARVHNTHNNYKSGQIEEGKDETLIVKVTNDENSFYDISRIGFKPEATEAWDIDFDAHKLFGATTAPQLWTISNNEIFAQNYLPYVYESYQLPLHFRAGVNTAHHLIFEGMDNFYPNSEIYLEDVFLEKTIDLREQQIYDFTAATTDEEGRFILHFYGITSTDEKPALQNTSIYSNQNTIYIRSAQIPQESYRLEVVNMMGQVVYATKLEPSILNSFKLNEKTGIYIVSMQTKNGSITQKVMIK